MRTCKDCIKYDACRKFKTCGIPCEDCKLIREHCFMSDDYAEYCEYYINKDECQKVVHAKWTNSCFYPTYESEEYKKNGLQTAYCTNCRITQTVNTYKGRVQFNFCPYCGAKMNLE